jgi:hypothetical protein
MRITKHQLVAGYPALKVRAFLRRYRVGTFVAAAAEDAFQANTEQAAELLAQLVVLGLIEPVEPKTVLAESGFELTSRGEAFASASAANPLFRKTAETLLQQFLERLDTVNSSPDYVYRVESAVLFGSMLSEAERLGDVDIAIELLPKVAEEAEFRKWCDRRRYAAREQGKNFRSSSDWIFWPREEIFEALRARSRTLSLHGIHDLAEMVDVRYRILHGDPKRVAVLIPAGQSS